jgi:predicted choloylglycine hydrolase
LEARFLSTWRRPAYIAGCAQTIWIDAVGREAPDLLRNYDFAPALLEGCWTATRWFGRRVVSMSDCLWGSLDGINEAGLVASLSFGGRELCGDGFGVPLILRYVLEVAETVAEASEVLRRIPSSMRHNIALLDRAGDWTTVFIAPDAPAEMTSNRTTTNLQHGVTWPAHARATRSVERPEHLEGIALRSTRSEKVTQALLKPPLFQTGYENGCGTLYTPVYCPRAARAELFWQGSSWSQTTDDFCEAERLITCGTA